MKRTSESRLQNPYDARIVQVLALSARPLTTNQISKFSGISYNTTTLHLTRLLKAKAVKKENASNRIYWTI
jgi:Fic family protein